MRIRLGYVAIALNLDKVTSSSTLTYSRYLKMDEENRLKKLKEVTYSNIEALEKILGYNIENNIHFYQVTTSKRTISFIVDKKDKDLAMKKLDETFGLNI